MLRESAKDKRNKRVKKFNQAKERTKHNHSQKEDAIPTIRKVLNTTTQKIAYKPQKHYQTECKI